MTTRGLRLTNSPFQYANRVIVKIETGGATMEHEIRSSIGKSYLLIFIALTATACNESSDDSTTKGSSNLSETADEISQPLSLGVNNGEFFNGNRAEINIPVTLILAPGGSFRLMQMEDVNSNAVQALGQWYYHTLN